MQGAIEWYLNRGLWFICLPPHIFFASDLLAQISGLLVDGMTNAELLIAV
jgi:hypothetical protein